MKKNHLSTQDRYAEEHGFKRHHFPPDHLHHFPGDRNVMKDQPDIIASVQFHTREQGGREGPTPPAIFRCPLEFEGEKFDCAMFLSESGPLAPGASATVPIKFLFPELIKPRLKVGSSFKLWEMKTIAEGVVEQILSD